MMLNGKIHRIRQNLHAFLFAVQGNEPPVLWIDAICIDQSSIQERNHQVTMMGSIYSQAACVYSWRDGGTATPTGSLTLLPNKG